MKDCELDELCEEFERQFPDLPCGGFYNPQVITEDDSMVEFRCFYDNYDDEEDDWTWYWDKKDKQFYN